MVISLPSHSVDLDNYRIELIEDISFIEVEESFLDEVANEGMVISYTSHAHKMLKRTAAQLNPKYNVYDEAKIYLFCSADESHKMVKNNPHILSLCPYSISIYKLSTEDGVYISYHKNKDSFYQGAQEQKKKIVDSVILELR